MRKLNLFPNIQSGIVLTFTLFNPYKNKVINNVLPCKAYLATLLHFRTSSSGLYNSTIIKHKFA